MLNAIVISPKCASLSAKVLAEYLDLPYDNPYQSNRRDFLSYGHVINYGFSRDIHANNLINRTRPIRNSINKIDTLSLLDDEDKIIVPFTLNKDTAFAWLDAGHSVVCRGRVDGSNSAGTMIVADAKDLNETPAQFWTQYVPHTNEYRVNLWRDKVVSVYDKVERDVGDGEGMCFSFELFQGQDEHPQLVALAKKVYDKIGLDWCGVDVLRGEDGHLHVLEVNSAPVLYPYTLRKLCNHIEQELNK